MKAKNYQEKLNNAMNQYQNKTGTDIHVIEPSIAEPTETEKAIVEPIEAKPTNQVEVDESEEPAI